MHAVAEIVIPPNADVVRTVKDAMDYFLKEDDDGNKRDYADWWDFYIIGGRWSGHKLEASLDPDKLKAFHDELVRRKVTVSGLAAGKEELHPKSQEAMVDAMWREMFPGNGNQCLLFKHARDQYRKEGYYADDVCKVSDVPARLIAERLIVVGPAWVKLPSGEYGDSPDHYQPKRMLVAEYWNHIEHQKSDWNGNVKEGIERIMADKDHRKTAMTNEWLVVTIDYHN